MDYNKVFQKVAIDVLTTNVNILYFFTAKIKKKGEKY
jgi:hypothetical protein